MKGHENGYGQRNSNLFLFGPIRILNYHSVLSFMCLGIKYRGRITVFVLGKLYCPVGISKNHHRFWTCGNFYALYLVNVI